jgi:hypothetical protein
LSRQHYLYFFEASGRIKIGISQNVKRRKGDITRTAGFPVSEIGFIPGSFALERHVHAMLESERLEGEWFKDCDTVRSVIAVLLEKGADGVGFVEQEKPTKFVPKKVWTREEHIEKDHKLLELIWPGEGYQQFAAFCEVPVEQVKRWFLREEKWPRVYRYCFASIVTMSCMTNEPPKSYIAQFMKDDEAADEAA